MPFASSAPYKLVKRKRMEPKRTYYSILISGKVCADPAADAGFGGIPWGADSQRLAAGRMFGRIGRFKGAGSPLVQAGDKLSTTADLTFADLRAILRQAGVPDDHC
jgi:hypothetical protein